MMNTPRTGRDLGSIEGADRILRDVPLIDGHNDWPWNVRNWFAGDIAAKGLDLTTISIGQTDLERLQFGRLGGQFWSAFVPCPKAGSELSDEAHPEIVRQTLQQIDLIYMIIETNPTRFGLARNVAQVWEVFRSGRLACLIGIEGLHQIGNSLSVLRTYHTLGVRYVTLTHSRNNIYADSATAEAVHGGLSEQGREAVREMNRIGLMVDLSHTSEAVQQQVLEMSQAPVIFSHSSCYSLTPHRRNTSDKILDMLKANGGIVMICFLRELVKPARGGNATLGDVADHVIYAGRRIGYAHVGIGSDFDGMLNGPHGLDEVSDFPKLVSVLLDRGLSEQEVRQVAGLNILRVMQMVGDAAMRLRREGNLKPACDTIVSSWGARERQMLVDEGDRRRQRREEGFPGNEPSC